jgi:hypothetical protein
LCVSPSFLSAVKIIANGSIQSVLAAAGDEDMFDPLLDEPLRGGQTDTA